MQVAVLQVRRHNQTIVRAAQLWWQQNTASFHLQHIYNRLSVRSCVSKCQSTH